MWNATDRQPLGAGPRSLLPARHPLPHLRCRDRLHLPLGRDLHRPSALRVLRDAGLHRRARPWPRLRLAPRRPGVEMTEGNAVPYTYVPDFGAELERLRPVELPRTQAVYRIALPGVMQVGADTLLAMSRKSSLWPLTFGLACCAI